MGPNSPCEQLARRPAAGRPLQLVDHLVLGHAEQGVEVERAVQQVERPLEHGRGRADAVVPIDLAEHDVAGEDHQFGGRLALVGDRQPVARLVQAQAAHQPLLVEVPAVGHARVQAVAVEIVHLVDVDRPGEHAGEDSAGRGRGASRSAGRPRRGG